ncbi:hypothetical protein DNHGIG_38850 [Collibacillus ludicampi]|uniref:Asp23/Gls24 family envelope stress response protein n=1 Tax=Collibacillus ludicampi TaxID=2771369 RepID=A0AAV4LKL6_9BACL|nr:Asp23/Gls24 family envelope stress response protein [Collibacillus ludicampi]GIM48336.1 hypothetical protein DNHGIG_38850 [Collibacillus ludicampi]
MNAKTCVTFSNKAIRSVIQRVFTEIKEAKIKRTVSVRRNNQEIEIELSVAICYGSSIPEIVKTIRKKIGEEMKQVTRLNVRSIDVFVAGIDHSRGTGGMKS